VTQSADGLERRLYELRRAFDASFEEPARSQELEQEDLLAIQVDSSRFAVRVSELSGVHAFRKVVPLPGALTGLLGLVGIRGRLVAAYRLADLISPGSAEGRPKWLLLCRGDNQVGLAIDGLEAYLRVPRADIHPVQGEEALGEHVRDVVQCDGIMRGVLSVQSILAAIARRARGTSNGRSRE
jgi:chemotaxis signal transduction protein